LQLGRWPHGGGEACHALLPSVIFNAVSPPPLRGSITLAVSVRMATRSDVAAYTCSPSAAIPHCTPPFNPPFATRVSHMISPFFSGSIAQTIPDFCPASSRSRPPVVDTRIAGDPKSNSGPLPGGQAAPLGS